VRAGSRRARAESPLARQSVPARPDPELGDHHAHQSPPATPTGGEACSRAAAQAYCLQTRGDRVEIVIDAGDEVRTYEVAATRNGRRVEINTGRNIVEVREVTRSGTPVRTARFMANRILALVEHPAVDRTIGDDVLP
jgi:hypothetical protein